MYILWNPVRDMYRTQMPKFFTVVGFFSKICTPAGRTLAPPFKQRTKLREPTQKLQLSRLSCRHPKLLVGSYVHFYGTDKLVI